LWEDGEGDEILWGGFYPPAWIVVCGIALWSFGVFAFVRPWKAGAEILLVGGTVLTLLMKLDGSFRLISKMCTYCLLLSIVWILEPLWMPPDAGPSFTTTELVQTGTVVGGRRSRITTDRSTLVYGKVSSHEV
jgi:hypothetical protein